MSQKSESDREGKEDCQAEGKICAKAQRHEPAIGSLHVIGRVGMSYIFMQSRVHVESLSSGNAREVNAGSRFLKVLHLRKLDFRRILEIHRCVFEQKSHAMQSVFQEYQCSVRWKCAQGPETTKPGDKFCPELRLWMWMNMKEDERDDEKIESPELHNQFGGAQRRRLVIGHVSFSVIPIVNSQS